MMRIEAPLTLFKSLRSQHNTLCVCRDVKCVVIEVRIMLNGHCWCLSHQNKFLSLPVSLSLRLRHQPVACEIKIGQAYISINFI